MKVRLEDIPPEGREVDIHLTRLALEELGPQVEGLVEPFRAHLLLERRDEIVQARGRFKARLRLTCSRCLIPLEYEVDGPLHMTFLPQSAEGREDVALSDDELEVSFYNGDEINLGEALRDELALNIPMAPLCREDCPGICPQCGRSLAQGPCGCKEKPLDPRWAKLTQLKNK